MYDIYRRTGMDEATDMPTSMYFLHVCYKIHAACVRQQDMINVQNMSKREMGFTQFPISSHL